MNNLIKINNSNSCINKNINHVISNQDINKIKNKEFNFKYEIENNDMKDKLMINENKNIFNMSKFEDKNKENIYIRNVKKENKKGKIKQ